ncbi:FIG01005984 hypothetical protein [Bradyrhizobium sp.]|uniref:hypothetical protein n=1 Tax=Bradyrhizobium sp. TaxID=376 RepID=UPI0007C1919F|nr:hypothetical protein [Bradyrhizobium sp.]CUT11450.1 FIG01005984 hypothetical protein [Bradyrhizobium sp.]
MPGISFAPHRVRYAFATYGERDRGFKPGEAALILDHMGGVEPKDVTGQFYSSDPQIGRKREMMRPWVQWCETWAQRAIEPDPMLLDRATMAARHATKRKPRPCCRRLPNSGSDAAES